MHGAISGSDLHPDPIVRGNIFTKNIMTSHRPGPSKILAAWFCILLTAPASAQTMFRCGNTYQDKPCDGGQAGKVIGNTRMPQTAAASADPACARRGAEAQKIKWGREAGRTEEVALAAAGSEDQRKLVSDVYSRGGTSSDLRAAIEADCAAEKEKSRATQSASGTVVGKPPAEEPKGGAKANAGSAADDADKKSRCDALKAQLAAMQGKSKEVKPEYQEAEKSLLRSAGC